ncbi:MAG: metallophosphoesterase [Gammaproteobacteria bacterium]|nr:metallophosphoesterase [Gammaproteobacteria bacterium]
MVNPAPRPLTESPAGAASFTFAHLSDPHLSTPAPLPPRDWCSKRALGYLSWYRKRRFEHRAEVLAALQRDLAQTRPDHLVITGDLTHIGQPEEFAQARRWLEALGPPERVSLVPGNHDSTVSAPWGETYAQWESYLATDGETDGAARFPSLRIRHGVALIGLSTAVPSPPLLAIGRLGTEQLARLAEVLTETGNQGLFRVIYLHHAPVPGQDNWRKRLVDAPALAAVVARCGAELLLHGHNHRTREFQLETGGRPVPVFGAASASAVGAHGEPGGYCLYRIWQEHGDWQLALERRRYDHSSDSFMIAEQHRLC